MRLRHLLEDKKQDKNEFDDIEAFDPKTMNALRDLKAKYPHADNVLAALVADIEDSQIKSKENDDMHDAQIEDLQKKIENIAGQLEQQKKHNGVKR